MVGSQRDKANSEERAKKISNVSKASKASKASKVKIDALDLNKLKNSPLKIFSDEDLMS